MDIFPSHQLVMSVLAKLRALRAEQMNFLCNAGIELSDLVKDSNIVENSEIIDHGSKLVYGFQ